MNFIVFYDRGGNPICYLSEKDDETIFLFNGNPVAYICDISVYSFKGKHLGWYENGWIYDNDGYCVLYTQNASGGPARPTSKVIPTRYTTGTKPVKGTKMVRPSKPVKGLQWRNSDNFFN